MYNLIRRISTSVIPRPDRPWEEDATSNAPSRKRRLSMDRDEETPNIKKAKAEQETPIETPSEPAEPAPEAQTESADELGESEATADAKNPESGVKEVTQGVKDLEVNQDGTQDDTAVAPENVPLPPEAADSPSPSIDSTPSPESDKSPDAAVRQESEKDDGGQSADNPVEKSDTNEGEESGTSTGAETSS